MTTDECTCGMELGKKLAAVEHLISSSPRLVGEGKTLNIDLRSSTPWAMEHTYISFNSTYGASDKRGVEVSLDPAGRQYTIDGKQGPLRELQSVLEARHLAHMIEDARKVYQQDKIDAAWVDEALSAMQKVSTDRPLDPSLREAWRFLPRAQVLRERASGLYDLLLRIDASLERWFVPYGGLSSSEVEDRLRKAGTDLVELEDIVELAPTHAAAQHALGALLITQYAETRLPQAAKALEKAVQLEPSRGAAHHDLGDVHFLRGDLPKAKEAYQRASELTRETLALSLFGLGQIAELENDLQAARGYFIRASRAEPDARARRVMDASAARIERKAAKKN
jgi:tetratricopeptide (TPR) repeat protein